MPTPLSRRHLLQAAAMPFAALALPPGMARAAAGAETPAIELRAETRSLAVKGRAATVLGLRQADGRAGVTLDPGARFRVQLVNRLDEATIVHWHGQTPPVGQDGVALTGFEQPIAPGAAQGYDFALRPGTYWMHSHQGMQEMQLLAAPLIVHTAEDLRADVQEVVVLLHDFTFRTPQAVMAGLTGGMKMGGDMKMGGGMPGMQTGSGDMPGMTMPGGGMGGMKMGGGMPGMTMSGGGMGGGGMGGGDMGGGDMGGSDMGGGDMGGNAAAGDEEEDAAAPAAEAGADLNDIDFDAYLANDRTLDDPEVVRTERGGRVRLRLINGAASTAFWIDLGTRVGSVLAVDGTPVAPVRGRVFPLAEAQRLDILLDVPPDRPCPVLAQRVGDRARTGIVLAAPGVRVRRIAEMADNAVGGLDNRLERRLAALTPLAPRAPDRRYTVTLSGGMMPYQWLIDGRRGWEDRLPLRVRQGERVVLDLVNQSGMAHPMHLHGHAFQVVALGGRPLAGAVRDTIQVLPRQSVSIAFDADNPGRWLFHCHNLAHMESGMITEVAYET
jgi:FtsP/CotA-like multicopper oxidase with cupredoxin domain